MYELVIAIDAGFTINEIKGVLKAEDNSDIPCAMPEFTPLLIAVARGRIDVLQLLIDCEYTKDKNEKVVEMAACKGSLVMVKLLIANGFNIDALSSMTIRSAIYNSHWDIVDFLVSNGCWCNSLCPFKYAKYLDKRHATCANNNIVSEIVDKKMRKYDYPADVIFN